MKYTRFVVRTPTSLREFQFSSVQSSCSVMSDSLRLCGLQHARPPCPSPTPGVYSSSCPLSWWCHPTISTSVVPFSYLQSFPASGSFQKSQFYTSGDQSIGVSASVSVLPMNIRVWFPLGLAGWISLQSKRLSRIFSNTTVQKHQFFSPQLSLPSNSHIHTWLWMNFIYSQTTLKIKKTCNILQHTIALTNLGWEWLPESNHSCPFHTYPKSSWISLSLSPLKVYSAAGFEAFYDTEEDKYPDYWIGKQDHTVALWLPYGILRGKSFHFLGHVSD